MKKLLFIILSLSFIQQYLKAQTGKLQIGVQTGFAIPQGAFKSGYGSYLDNGYATIGQNYKIYAEYRVQNAFCVGLNYLYYTNSLEEGNLHNGFNNRFSTNNAKVDKNSSTSGLLASLLLKGQETPFFIKGFLGLGYSTSATISAKNTVESITILPATSDLGLITGIGIGFYVPIRDKWFIELEADYISCDARPGNMQIKDNVNNETYSGGNINYNQTVINLNLGVGIFLFHD